MNKLVFRLIIVFIFIFFLFIICFQPVNSKTPIEKFNWNRGYCELDGGRLNYVSVGSKYHYKCEICGKEYRFDKVMPRK